MISVCYSCPEGPYVATLNATPQRSTTRGTTVHVNHAVCVPPCSFSSPLFTQSSPPLSYPTNLFSSAAVPCNRVAYPRC